MKATMSILGLHNATDGDIWEVMTMPDDIDRGTVIISILAECAELEVIYPNPDTMRLAIAAWSWAEQSIWEKLYATTQFDYNPIWNKDGTVTETETAHRLHSELGSDDEKFSSEGSSSRSQSDSGSMTTQVAAYDSSAFNNREKNDTSAGSTEHVVADNENVTERDLNRDNLDANDRTYERRETGNIGVTTTQQMIIEEREVDQFNIYDYIVQSFKRRFCLLVY